MKFAYADPPYIGQAKKHYSHDPRCAEVDHDQLLADLANYDGWALSCSSTSLKKILTLPNCPEDVRIASWVKPFAIFKPGVNPVYAWEPVLFWGGRKRTRYEASVRDWVSVNVSTKTGLAGTKPAKFCYWIFQILNMQPGDEFADLYPGTGGVTRAWDEYQIAQLDKVEQQSLFVVGK